MRVLFVIVLGLLKASEAEYTGTYAFYRSLDNKAQELGTRRVFGGTKVELKEFPTICLLLDGNSNIKCSCSIISAKWALTAGHCVTPTLKYVKYNTENPAVRSGKTAAIFKAYRHPEYKAVSRDEGQGMDVVELYHDIGLVKTKREMTLEHSLGADPLVKMRAASSNEMLKKRAKVIGFGRSDGSTRTVGEFLSSADLRIVPCGRSTWIHCICGNTDPGFRTKGVCAGDSGGPVILNGVQIGVTSMGPVECVTKTDPAPGATSVFTSLRAYTDLINNTINGYPDALKLKEIPLVDAGCKTAAVSSLILVQMLLIFLQ